MIKIAAIIIMFLVFALIGIAGIIYFSRHKN